MWHKVNFWAEYSWFEFIFSLSSTRCFTQAKELSLPYYLSIDEREEMD